MVGGLADGVAHDARTVVTHFKAAVAGEVIKGFHVAHEACGILRETRSDFDWSLKRTLFGRM
jgi:hypothetical protein